MTPQELRARRDALGLSQVGLAKRLGVASVTVCRWESGQRKLPPLLPLAMEQVEKEREG